MHVDGGNVAADNVHADATSETAHHENIAAPEFVDEEEQPEQGKAGLNNAVYAGCEEAGICALDPDALENSRRVVTV